MAEKTSTDQDTPTASAKPPPKTGFARFWPAIKHSVYGLKSTLKTESAFRQEVCGFFILTPIALWFGGSNAERVLLIAPMFLVLIVELLNTAVEHAVDRLGTEYNDFTKNAKDAGSAAVFISLFLVLFSWVMILLVPLL